MGSQNCEGSSLELQWLLVELFQVCSWQMDHAEFSSTFWNPDIMVDQTIGG